ncbi:hypothetical protein UY3_12183 [Chelonia mydas]|uniref:Uncharacterized protein n=1 Tax=Chelonia mydas TaxID=8469 RepID=M7AYX1_CHEMY|nr:hypothetical protein UY3_12183 [Chelonia mydas]
MRSAPLATGCIRHRSPFPVPKKKSKHDLALSKKDQGASVTTSEKHQTAPAAWGSVHKAQSDARMEERVSTPKSPSPMGDDAPGSPPVIQSSSSSPDEAVAWPSHANPPDDFKEHQALL